MFQNIGIINNLRKYIKGCVDFFKISDKSFMGIYIGENDIFCIQVKKVNYDKYEVVYTEHINADIKNDIERKNAIEVLENSLNKAGIFEHRAALYVDERDVYCYGRNIHEFDGDDLYKAVHWDLEANEPFDGDYIEGYSVFADRLLIGAVCRQDIEEYADGISSADIDIYMSVTSTKEIEYKISTDNIVIDNIVVDLPDNINSSEIGKEGINALYAAISADMDLCNSIKFWLRNRKLLDWQWEKISIVMLSIVFLLSSMLVGVEEYKIYEIKNELSKQTESLYLLSDVLESKKRTDVLSTEIENKTKLLKDLSKDSWPVYAILTHLGCINCDGVWLTDLSTDKDVGIELKGEAVSYNSLVKYYQALDDDKDFFAGGAVLEKSDLQENGHIGFQIRTNLK